MEAVVGVAAWPQQWPLTLEALPVLMPTPALFLEALERATAVLEVMLLFQAIAIAAAVAAAGEDSDLVPRGLLLLEMVRVLEAQDLVLVAGAPLGQPQRAALVLPDV